MHDQTRGSEIGVGGVGRHHPAEEALAAQGVEIGHEAVLLRCRCRDGCTGGQAKNGGGENGDLFHWQSLARRPGLA